MLDWLIPFNTVTKKKRAAGLVIFAILLTLFLLFNRIPKFGIVEGDLEAVSGLEIQCFQGFCIEAGPDTTFWSRWWEFSVTYLELVAVGMTFAFLVAGVAEAFLFGGGDGRAFSSRGLKGTLKGLVVGPAMTLCSACIVPISSAFRRGGASVEATISIVQGSATMNLPALIMAALVFAPMLSGSRIALSVLGALMIGPLVAMAAGRREREMQSVESLIVVEPMDASWRDAIFEGFFLWLRASFGYLIRLGPIMVIAGFASGLVVQWISPATVDTFLGNNVTGVVMAATIGVLINVPLMFEIPLVAALLLVGMGTAPAATLLFAAAAGGPITFWGLAKVLPRKATATFVGATWGFALIGGLGVVMIDPLFDTDEIGLRDSVLATRAASAAPSDGSNGEETGQLQKYNIGANGAILESDSDREFYQSLGRAPVTPFINVAPYALKNGGDRVWNWRPGVVVFDYDQDRDHDFYVTNSFQNGNLLYRNEGDGTFVNVAESAGVAAYWSHSAGAVACDVNNDGYQDLYVGGRGLPGKSLGYRSAMGTDDIARRLHTAAKDRLFVNNSDGTFTEITDSAFGDDLNLRTANGIVCADVDGDGWLDLYVGNLITEDLFEWNRPSIPGHYNVLYLNNRDLTFTDVAESAGVQGPEILFLDPQVHPIEYEDPETGRRYQGYDPLLKDAKGNPVGDPTAQTFAVLFFDYDEDGDPDLWLSNDGDRLLVFRNDSTPGNVKFVPVAAEMEVDLVGNWMGFAVGDYDGDADLDLFITNAGYHPLTRPPVPERERECPYSGPFDWATCAHFLLRNDGTRDVPGLGTVGDFKDVAATTVIVPSIVMPPDGFDPNRIVPPWEVPTGLAAYGFGFGTTFFDFDNDGDQDLYWLGSSKGRGQGPSGDLYPGAGHMFRGDGRGSFEDITVRARLLDIENVDYASFDPRDPEVTVKTRELREKFHENGKGLAHGDLNGDGYVDLIGTNSTGPVFVPGGVELQAGPIFVWMNGGGDNHWISLRLTGRMAIDGTGSNADGIGARVYVKTIPKGATEPLVQVQEVLAGSSYLSMDSIDLEFGVGTATVVEEIRILWPSGREQVLNDVSVDQAIGITEPRG